MTAFTLSPKYIDILQAIGNVQETAEEAVRFYITQKIGERIGRLQHEILVFEKKYELSCERFRILITTDENFVENLRKSHPTWERDFNTWEYYTEELNEWLGHLESISKI